MLDISGCLLTKKTEFLDQWSSQHYSFHEKKQIWEVSKIPDSFPEFKTFFIQNKVSLFFSTSAFVFFLRRKHSFQRFFFFFLDQIRNFFPFSLLSFFSRTSLGPETLDLGKNSSFLFPLILEISSFKLEKNWKKRKLFQNFCTFVQNSDLFFQKIFFYTFSVLKKKVSISVPLNFFLLFFENISKNPLNFLHFEKKEQNNEALYFSKTLFKLVLFYRSFVSFFGSFFLENFFPDIAKSCDLAFEVINQKIAQCFSFFPFYIGNFSVRQNISSKYFFSCAYLSSFFAKVQDVNQTHTSSSFLDFSQRFPFRHSLQRSFFLFQKFAWPSSLEKILFEFSTPKKVCLEPWFQRHFFPFFLKYSCFFSGENFSFFSKTKEVLKKVELLLKKFWSPDFWNYSLQKGNAHSFFSLPGPSVFPSPLPFFPTNVNCLKKKFFLFSNLSHSLKFQSCLWRVSEKFISCCTVFSNQKNFLLSPLFSCFFLFQTFFSDSFTKTREFLVFSHKKVDSLLVLDIFQEYEFQQISYTFPFLLDKKLKKVLFCDKQPTLENLKNHLKGCQKIVSSSLGKDQFSLMKKLKKKIFHWANFSSEVFPRRIYFYCDFILFQYLWKWARKTHPKKSKSWIRQKYFFCVNSKIWFFGFKQGNKRICLPLHSQIKKD